MNELFLIGRLIFGGFFAYNGLNHFLSLAGTAQYAAAKGVRWFVVDSVDELAAVKQRVQANGVKLLMETGTGEPVGA